MEQKTKKRVTLENHQNASNKHLDVFIEIIDEISRQDEKWGPQSYPMLYPNISNSDAMRKLRIAEIYKIPTDNVARDLCEKASERKELTWGHILSEEFSEAMCSKTPQEQIDELIQLAAVCVQAATDLKSKL